MSDMTITEFCDKHYACPEGREWALMRCRTMADVWATAKPAWLVWVATQNGVLTNRELRLFSVWAARQVQHLMVDPRSIEALNVAERHANGAATDAELAAAADAARDAAYAARDAVEAPHGNGIWEAALAAREAGSSELSAAWVVGESAGAAEAHAAAAGGRAAGNAAWAATTAAQSDWLRANTTPNFKAKEPRRCAT